jgi:hypothetical protein
LILRDINSGEIIWDSFSHLADAVVPSMRIYANRVTSKKISFVSKKSEIDSSSGNFSISFERLDAPKVLIWHNKNIYWRTGPWNGRVFLGLPRMTTEYHIVVTHSISFFFSDNQVLRLASCMYSC